MQDCCFVTMFQTNKMSSKIDNVKLIRYNLNTQESRMLYKLDVK